MFDHFAAIQPKNVHDSLSAFAEQAAPEHMQNRVITVPKHPLNLRPRLRAVLTDPRRKLADPFLAVFNQRIVLLVTLSRIQSERSINVPIVQSLQVEGHHRLLVFFRHARVSSGIVIIVSQFLIARLSLFPRRVDAPVSRVDSNNLIGSLLLGKNCGHVWGLNWRWHRLSLWIVVPVNWPIR